MGSGNVWISIFLEFLARCYSERMENKNILIVGVVVGIIIGFVGGRYLSFGGALMGSGSVAELEAKIEKAKKLFPSMPDMRSVSGTIETIKENSLTIKTPPSMNPFEDLPEKREVIVTSATKIIRLVQKDPKVFQKEMEAIQKPMKPGEPVQPPPTPFIEKAISLKDLKVGDQVSAEAGENIKEKARFDATRIVVQEVLGGALPPTAAGAFAPPPPPPSSALPSGTKTVPPPPAIPK